MYLTYLQNVSSKYKGHTFFSVPYGYLSRLTIFLSESEPKQIQEDGESNKTKQN